MSREKSRNIRLRNAVNEALNEHDGAYKCTESLKVIAEKYGVGLQLLMSEVSYAVKQRDEEREQYENSPEGKIEKLEARIDNLETEVFRLNERISDLEEGR